MKTAYVFPGQGSQFKGMGLDLYQSSDSAKALFEKANEILGFDITKIMFEGTDEELKQTNVTQPAIFIHSVILAKINPDFSPNMVAGHSLGEYSALVCAGVLSLADAVKLVDKVRIGVGRCPPGIVIGSLGLRSQRAQAEQCQGERVDFVVHSSSRGIIVFTGVVKPS